MIKEYLKYNLRLMWKRKSFQFVFWGMILLCIVQPVYYVIKYWGSYIYELPSADTLYIANSGSDIWSYIQQLFSFLIVLPFGFSYLDEKKFGVNLYLQSRGERKAYYYSQLIACFIGTAMVILLPFLINIALNGIIFPINGNDYISTYDAYDYNWCSKIMGNGFKDKTLFQGHILKSIFIEHPQLYNVIYALIGGISSGVMGMFVYAISILVEKNRIWVLIINYLFFSVFTVLDRVIENIFPIYINVNLTEYLSDGHFNHGRVYPIYIAFLLLEVFISIGIVRRQWKKDEE